MNDDTLHSLRETPSDAFVLALRSRLRTGDADLAQAPRARGVRMLLKPALVAAVFAALLAMPSVRASAQSFLSLFRLRTFLAVPVNNMRAREIASRLDVEALLGGHVDILRAPGVPVDMETPELASAQAGFTVRLPTALPDQTERLKTAVAGPSSVKVHADSAQLGAIMEALGIDDLSPPQGLDGQVIGIEISPVVYTMYRLGESHEQIEFVQARVPHVQLPSGVDMAALGEIALRILGLKAADAHEMAEAIDWHTTLLIPLPPVARNFRQVDIGGVPGLLVEKGPPERADSLLLWSTADRAYAMAGRVDGTRIVALANSVR